MSKADEQQEGHPDRSGEHSQGLGSTLRDAASLPGYSTRQLALRNGSDKPETWVAFKGIIYDVSDSRLWRNGLHYGVHWAGQDLTEELKDAPHSDAVFQRFEAIGRLDD